jgi:hypothetical protein
MGVDPEDDLGLDADLDLDSDDEDEAPAPLPMVVPWELLNSNEFDTALSELSDWVRWLVRLYHYGPDVVPPCWYLHGDLREELGHLHSGWLMTRHPQAGVGAIGLEWDRHRDVTMARCKTITSACGCATASTFKEHKEPAGRPWPADYDADLVTYLAAERDRRDASRIAPAALEAAEKVLMTLEVRGPLARRAVKQAAATAGTSGPGQVAEALRLLTAYTRSGPVVAAEKALRAAALRADALVREQAEAALTRARTALAGVLAAGDVHPEQAADAWLAALEEYSPAAEAVTAAAGRVHAVPDTQSPARGRTPGVEGLLGPGTSD